MPKSLLSRQWPGWVGASTFVLLRVLRGFELPHSFIAGPRWQGVRSMERAWVYQSP